MHHLEDIHPRCDFTAHSLWRVRNTIPKLGDPANAREWGHRSSGHSHRQSQQTREERSGEDVSPLSGDSAPLEGFILGYIFYNVLCDAFLWFYFNLFQSFLLRFFNVQEEKQWSVIEKWWVPFINKIITLSNIHKNMVVHRIKEPFGSNAKESKVTHVGDSVSDW